MTETPTTETLSATAIEALEARGINVRIAAQCGVASIVQQRSTDAWLLFPHDHGFWTARTVTGEPRFHQELKGQRGLWRASEVLGDASLRSGPLIITEGHLDALALMTVGYRAVCSVPDGAPPALKPDAEPRRQREQPEATAKYRYLGAIRDQLREWPSIILAVDNDGPGKMLLDDLARVVGRSRVRVPDYGPGCKDANDVLVAHGPEALVACIDGARWLTVGGIYEYDALPKLDLPKALVPDVAGVRDLWRLRPGEISVLAGIPGHGKTALANAIGVSMARDHGWAVCWMSPEQHPSIHRHRLAHVIAGRYQDRQTEAEANAAADLMRSHFVWLAADRDEPASVEWLCERIATVAWRYNVSLMIVDPWNHLDHDRDVTLREDEYEREMLRRLGYTAVECGVHIMILVHGRKPAVDRSDGKTIAPTGYAISGSAHWVNRPDLGATIHRAGDGTNQARFICWKARYADGQWYDNGKRGESKIGLDLSTMRYIDMTDSEG